MKFDAVYIGVIVVLVAVVTYVLVQPSVTGFVANPGEKAIADSIKSLYELQYESLAEVTNMTEQNGIYHFTVKFVDYTGKPAVQDVFVTKDGQLLTDRFLIIDNYKKSLDFQKRFVDCLNVKGVRILGQTADQATMQQLNILGTYSYKIFASCDGTNDQTCKNLGIRRYPTTVFNNTGYDNIYGADFYANLTGCPLQ